MIKYGLRHKPTNKILHVYTSDNAGSDGTYNCCVTTQHTLTENAEDNLREWYADTPIDAEFVRRNSTAWYNANYETPTHHFEFDELEVVEIDIPEPKIKVLNIKLPTIREIFEWKEKKYYPNQPINGYRNVINNCIQDGIINNFYGNIHDIHEYLFDKNKKDK